LSRCVENRPPGVKYTVLAHQVAQEWVPSTPAERALVQEQLERLLATSHFSSSRRYPSFLRFVVQNALSGQAEQLKERILGVEVFGRHADYDTATDPIVRVTAAEIRKRIEQYYQEAGHDEEIRISLPVGSYIPQFFHPGKVDGDPHHRSGTAASTLQPNVMSAADLEPSTEYGVPRVPPWLRTAFLVALIVALAAVSLYAARRWYPTAIKAFWAPFLGPGEPVLFCIADQNQYSTIKLRDAADPQRELILSDPLIAVIIDDVGPLINIAGFLRTYGKTYRVQGEASTSLTDLRRGPAIFIGAFDNSWTLRLTAPLRFHFANTPDMSRFWIEDRSNPGKRDWVLDRDIQQRTRIYKDYAIVARLIDPNSDQYVVVVAGIGRGGTVAAGEFLVDPKRMDEISNYAPKDWDRKNIEIVVETQVIQDRSGPPRIAAVHVW
jgi:hypothetical protein